MFKRNHRIIHFSRLRLFSFILFLIFSSRISLSAQPLFNPQEVESINLVFQENNWDHILDSLKAEGKERLIGSIEIDGEIFDSVGIRYKGNSKYLANRFKNPFNIKLDHIRPKQSYQGISTLKLANGFADPSFVREVVAYEIAAKYMPAPKAAHIRVNVNGEYHGLYVNTETIDKAFVKNWFGSNEKAFFKCEPEFAQEPLDSCSIGNYASLEYVGEDSTCYEINYELKSDHGWDRLIQLTETLASNPDSLEKILDFDQVLWMLAFNNVLVNLDSYSGKFCHNYYLYQDDYDIFHPIVWDLNMAFGGFNHTGIGGLLKLAEMRTLDPLLHQNDSIWPLISQIISQPKWEKRYLAHLKTILYENINNDWYKSRAEEIQEVIDPYVKEDSNALFPYADFQNNIYFASFSGGFRTGIVDLMDERANYLVAHPKIQPIGPLLKNAIHSPTFPKPNDSVLIRVDGGNANQVWVGMRTEKHAPFQEFTLFDDGLHGDGNAGDHIWGRKIKVSVSDVEYYFYAENNEAGRFLPARAQFKFRTIKVYDRLATPPIVINEILPDNESIQVDQNGEFDDWVEFFNGTETAISLQSFGLTDDISLPFKWIFPDTLIQPNAYLMVWADGEPTQGGLHTGFRLDKSGEKLWLIGPDSLVLDSVHFPSQNADISWGRFPNGFGDFFTMNPTFESENDFFTEIEPELSTEIKVYPNPVNHWLEIEFYEMTNGKIDVLNLNGQILLQETVSAKQARINVEKLPSGVYMIRLNTKTPSKFLKTWKVFIKN